MAQNENNVISRAKSSHKELKKMHELTSKIILPELDIKLRSCQPSPKDCALRDTFIRIYLVVGSIIKLNHFKDFHVLASVTRTVFELYIDMHLLYKDKIDNGFEKFTEFGVAKKFSTTKARKNWAEQNKFPFDKKFPRRVEYLQNMASNKIPKKIQQLWKSTKCPDHWSALSVSDRVAKLGTDFIEKYIMFYDIGNWYIHSGPFDWKFLGNGTSTNIIAAFAYESSVEMFRECYNICANHFNLKLNCANK